MPKSRSNQASQIIVDPQELTKFLRHSKDLTEFELDDVSSNLGNLKSEKSINGLSNDYPKHVPKNIPKTGYKRFIGIACAFTTGILYQIVNVIIKILENHHPVNLSFWRYFGFILPTLPYLLGMKIFKNVNLFSSIGFGHEIMPFCDNPGCCKVPVKYRNMFNVFAATALGAPVFILRYTSLHYLTIADSTVILYSGSLFTIIFGHCFLNEKCGFVTIAISIFTLFGVVVVARPTFLTGGQEMDAKILIGIGLTLISTVLASMLYITLRNVRHVSFVVVNFTNGVMGLIIAGTVAWVMDVMKLPEGLVEILLVVGIGILSFMSGCLLTAALKFEEAGTVNIIRMVDVFYGFLFQFLWFGLVPDIYSIIGGSIVITGVTLITLRKLISTMSEEHWLRRTCCLLLY